jgi:hypothetical protein
MTTDLEALVKKLPEQAAAVGVALTTFLGEAVTQ